MGKPGRRQACHPAFGGRRNRPKQNILVGRGKEIKRDALSSGERKGLSPNLTGAMVAALARGGLRDTPGGDRHLLGELQNFHPAEVPWNGAPQRVIVP